MLTELMEIEGHLTKVKTLSKEFKKKYKGAKMAPTKELGIPMDGFNYRVVDILWEEECVEILYDFMEEDGEESEDCVEYVNLKEFIKWVALQD